MARRKPVGLLSVRVPPEPPPKADPSQIGEAVTTLPSSPVLEAGVDKFLELTKIGVARSGSDSFASFDFSDRRLLRVVLGLTYIAMEGVMVEELGRPWELGRPFKENK